MNKQFIKATEKACSFDEYIASPYLRKSFELDFVPEKAELSICGLGFYVLCIKISLSQSVVVCNIIIDLFLDVIKWAVSHII